MKALFWLLYLPLLVIVAVFAASNRHVVEISLDPFPFDIDVPLFMVVLVSVLIGLLAGGFSAWRSGRHWRQNARQLRRHNALLETEISARRDRTAREPDRTDMAPALQPDQPTRIPGDEKRQAMG